MEIIFLTIQHLAPVNISLPSFNKPNCLEFLLAQKKKKPTTTKDI